MIDEKINLTSTKINGQALIFNTPNDMCLWRVKTILTKEPHTIEWLNTITEKDIFWDVGANIGLYSIYSAFFKKCQVYSFEPESQNYALINRNISLNKLNAHINAYCLALSDKSSINYLKLSASTTGSSGHSINQNDKSSQGCVTFTINELVDLGLPCPTHLKVDIDGFDHLVLYGATKVLSNVQSIIIELDLSNTEQMKVINFLEDHNFYYNPKQVEKTARPKGDKFENLREFIFNRY